MIVRCSNCNSAFAVDDAKVENKKFAFTCPKCASENVLDNRSVKKPVPVGPSVIDEAFQDNEMDGAGGKDRERQMEGFMEDLAESSRDRAPLDDGTSLMSTSLSESEDLSGLAEPEKLEGIDDALDLADLPPADDMRSDIVLDDLTGDEALAEIDPQNVAGENIGSSAEMTSGSDTSKTEEDEWSGLEKEIEGFSAESTPIKDEMDSHEEGGEPINLETIDDIDALIEEEGGDKEIIDDFEPLGEEEMRDSGSAGDAESGIEDDIKTEEMYRADSDVQEESISIDLDALEGDLNESIEPLTVDSAVDAGISEDEIREAGHREEDEDITIDLDSLDIELQEGDEFVSGEVHEELDLDIADFSDETVRELEEVPHKASTDHDEDITLDLDSLDIALEESDEFREGEIPDQDEKLTLEDAGLTMDELAAEDLDLVASSSEGEEDDIKLTLAEIDPDLDMHAIEKELREAESILAESPEGERDLHIVDEISELPDIDFDEVLEPAAEPASGIGMKTEYKTERAIKKKSGLQKELPDMVPRGSVSFSIDYSIRYSRAGALLRLFGLFFIGLLPHYLVFFVYALLSLILGAINHAVVIATGKSVEDFSEIHENTLRYLLSISASMTGVVEEMPIFAGRDNIDYPLQMKIIYPLRSSRLLALLRLTGIGIIVAVLPHLLVLFLMSIMSWLVYVVGVVSVLAVGRWPHVFFDFMTRYYRLTTRVLAFTIGVVDVYPRFRFD